MHYSLNFSFVWICWAVLFIKGNPVIANNFHWSTQGCTDQCQGRISKGVQLQQLIRQQGGVVWRPWTETGKQALLSPATFIAPLLRTNQSLLIYYCSRTLAGHISLCKERGLGRRSLTVINGSGCASPAAEVDNGIYNLTGRPGIRHSACHSALGESS